MKRHGWEEADLKRFSWLYSSREASITNLEHRLEGSKEQLVKKEKELVRLDKVKNPKKTVRLQNQIADLQNEIKDIEAKKDATEKEIKDFEKDSRKTFTVPGTGKTEPEGLTRFAISEYELANELGVTNRKRVVRQGIHINVNLAKIGGAIATLVGGYGAPVGIAIKAAASGVDISLPFFRAIKQWGRNQAAKDTVRGKTGTLSQKIYNADKSSAVKLAMRQKHALRILLMVAHLNRYIPDSGAIEQKKQAKLKEGIARVETYIHATGASPRVLYQHNGDIDKQIHVLVKAMMQRELGGG